MYEKEVLRNYFNISSSLSNDEVLVYFHLCKSTNFTKDKYEGREKFECFCSKRTLSNDTGIGDKKVLSTLKSLEEKGYIKLISKGKPPKTPSKYKMIYAESIKRMEPLEEPLKEPLKEPFKSVENTKIINGKEPLKEPIKEPLEDPPSKDISKDMSNNIYSAKNNENVKLIFDYWNSKEIIKHRSLTLVIEKAIEKALKVYLTKDIVQAINVYSDILNSTFYFNYKWSLNDFLNRKNGISTFMEEGSNKANYDDWKRGEDKNEYTKGRIAKDRGRFTEGTENFKFKEISTNVRSYTEEEISRAGLK
ncbi:helix-turn-helix domain-containing protein [Clostridium sardiniense]|uniref:helix-turn-helix domain-containing protein n=1 Tax=Clostridium sardiniense TaxID=29369 RepID=UPI00195E3410|nr:hypothetical protein [Clostridium sardiniense]